MTPPSAERSDIYSSKAEKLPRDQIQIAKGVVEATLVQKVTEPAHLEEWFRLPSGEEIHVAPGEALVFKVDGGWKKAHFFDEGRIVGPVVFARDIIERPKKVYRSHYHNEMSPLDILIMLSITAFLMWSSDAAGPIYVFEIIAIVITFIAFSWFAWNWLSFLIPYWRGDEACLAKLNEETERPMEI